ncbi:RNA-binding protein putative UPB2 [Leptomonas pyrrhocoris]|uniref:RNA-binding protein putative UPB2 n=1 Tax=Leptomonas pyrrhocoris TaxID=157538 RepID=A0A0M9G002_LEPPY|nr:RNA-binding protein putative UPB2 [Leptomonas pyrrhocoris]KPA79453.1 RNA-binding protein putative UPB2 [Leptomonas pyrrhocoris]|eukprot:XP_015657892.1 RNA-binding protein putative UPB2 [Leptomonas pyrrhocoris]
MSQQMSPQQQQPQQQQQSPQQQEDYNPEPEALRNLMVNYIPTTVDEMQLRQLFERFGPIESVKILFDRDTRQSRGYGFVKYQTAASAQQAVNELNGFNILNKRLKVALAASGNQRPRNNYNNNNNQQQMAAGAVPQANYYAGNFAAAGYAQPNPYAQQQMMAAAMPQQYMMPQPGQQPRQ